MVRIILAKHSRFSRFPHRPGRQKTTCDGSGFGSAAAAAVNWVGPVACMARIEVELGPEVEPVAVGSGGCVTVLHMAVFVSHERGEEVTDELVFVLHLVQLAVPGASTVLYMSKWRSC